VNCAPNRRARESAGDYYALLALLGHAADKDPGTTRSKTRARKTAGARSARGSASCMRKSSGTVAQKNVNLLAKFLQKGSGAD